MMRKSSAQEVSWIGSRMREARIAEAAGELERPDAVLVHDGVEVDVADMAVLAQQRRDALPSVRSKKRRPRS